VHHFCLVNDAWKSKNSLKLISKKNPKAFIAIRLEVEPTDKQALKMISLVTIQVAIKFKSKPKGTQKD
jgi:hypothetical protein